MINLGIERSAEMKLESTFPAGSPALGRDIIRSGDLASDSSARAGLPRKTFNLLVSLAIHSVILLAMATLPFLVTEEEIEQPELKMDMVLVRMPTPEPPGSQSGGGAPAEEKPQ